MITIFRSWVAAAPALSVTWTLKFTVPAMVGVPLITPVAEFRFRPTGRVPVITTQAVKILLPPEAARVCE